MKKTLLLIMMFLTTLQVFSQIQTYPVLETQQSDDGDNYFALPSNPIFTKISFDNDTIILSLVGNAITKVPLKSMEKINFTEDAYGLDFEGSNGDMKTRIMMGKYPTRTSGFRPIFIQIGAVGMNRKEPRVLTFYKLVFFEKQRI